MHFIFIIIKLKQNIGLDVFHALTTMEIHSAFGLTKEEGGKLWTSLRDDIYYSECAPFPHAVDILHELVEQGHEVYYITARAKEHTERTRNGLLTMVSRWRKDIFIVG